MALPQPKPEESPSGEVVPLQEVPAGDKAGPGTRPRSLPDRFARLYAGVIHDTMRFDLKVARPFVVSAVIKPIWPLPPSRAVFGPAFTCLGRGVADPAHLDDTVRIQMFRSFSAGCVQVIDTGGDEGVAHFGDISGKLARKFGAQGAVVDGFTRDARLLEQDHFPVFCRGAQPIDAYGRWQIVEYQVPVDLAGIEGPVRIWPGDYVFGDADGVLVIPQDLVGQVALGAERRQQRQDTVRHELAVTDDVQGLYDRIGRW